MLNGERQQTKLKQPWIGNEKRRDPGGVQKNWIDGVKQDLERLYKKKKKIVIPAV